MSDVDMKERPILFSAPMVRALLDGRKTQTRRIVKLPANAREVQYWAPPSGRSQAGWADPGVNYWTPDPSGETSSNHIDPCPYGQPGDRLIVSSEIPGIPRAYCAGSDGAIYSRARGEWRPLKAHGNQNGYPNVTIMIDGRKTTRAVHTLVCSAFYGSAPFQGAQVRHLDGDSANSAPANLAWGTQAESWLDRRSHWNGNEGEKHHAAKFSNDERSHIVWAIDRGLCSERGAARALGLSQSAVQQMRSNWSIQTIDPIEPASRIPTITLEITGVRVELLQDISEEDAYAEGIKAEDVVCSRCHGRTYHMQGGDSVDCEAPGCGRSAADEYRDLWESINGGGTWDANPWVRVVEFRKLDGKEPGK